MHNFLIKKKLFVCGTCDEKEMEAILIIINHILVYEIFKMKRLKLFL